MKSTITVRSKFDFRGETFDFALDVVLPPYIEDEELFLEQLPQRIAKHNNLDVISYKFEMLESSEIEVIRFQSRIESAIPDLPMRVERFIELYQKVGPDAYLQEIAENHQIDLDANPQIAKALKAAYDLGYDHKPKKQTGHNTWF